MNESQAISQLKALCATHLQGFEVVRIGSNAKTASQYDATFAVITNDGNISQALISDILKDKTDNGGKLEYVETKREINDLKTEVLIVTATIDAHKL